MDNNIIQMREFIMLTEEIASALAPVALSPIGGADEPGGHAGTDDGALMSGLGDLVEKLRSHSEDGDGEQSLGVEMGMQRAADMIDRLLRRHAGDRDFG